MKFSLSSSDVKPISRSLVPNGLCLSSFDRLAKRLAPSPTLLPNIRKPSPY